MENNMIRKDGRDYVNCPLVDDFIVDIDCLENRAVTDHELIEGSMPQKFKQKSNWRNICANCKWHDY